MNALDWSLIALLAVGTILGLARGLVRIVIGILSLVVAFVLASRWQDGIANVLIGRHVSEGPARVAAYLAVFLATMLAGGLVAWAVGKILKLAMLSWADRFAGGALGLLGATLAAALLVHPIVASTSGGPRLLATSTLAPYLTRISDLGNAVAPDSVAERYRSGIEGLRRIWRGEEPIPFDLGRAKDAIRGALKEGKRALGEGKKKVVAEGKQVVEEGKKVVEEGKQAVTKASERAGKKAKDLAKSVAGEPGNEPGKKN